MRINIKLTNDYAVYFEKKSLEFEMLFILYILNGKFKKKTTNPS